LFKSFVSQRRPQIDIGKVATGEIWYGQRAIDERLVDGLLTSDSYLQDQVASADVYRVIYHEHQSLQQKIGDMMHHVADKTFLTVLSRNQENQHSRY
jgi:serine protease SohB